MYDDESKMQNQFMCVSINPNKNYFNYNELRNFNIIDVRNVENDFLVEMIFFIQINLAGETSVDVDIYVRICIIKFLVLEIGKHFCFT